MRTGGWLHPVEGQDWPDLVERYRTAPPVVSPIADVIESIVASGVSDQLRFATSMWDLIVTPVSVGPPPTDVVAVRGAMGLRRIADGRILVEHLPLVGTADCIERDASHAVSLFWRFMLEKYGVTRPA